MNTKMRWPVLLTIFLGCSILPGVRGWAADHSSLSTSGSRSQPLVQSLSITEASGIVALPGGHFLVVDDEKGILLLSGKGTVKELFDAKMDKHLWDLEGICLSTDKKSIYCLSERKGTITRLPLKIKGDDVELGSVEKLGKLPEIGKDPSKGWEGISTFLNKGHDQLVAIHQEKPRAIGLFELPSLEPVAIKELPDNAKALLDTLSDVTIDQRTGHLFLLGGQSQRVVEMDCIGGQEISTFKILNQFDLPLGAEERAEGICFDNSDHLVIVTDGGGVPGKIIRFP